jgi:WD40 repeat protein
MYECKNPYPLASSSTFYYVANGQAWSRCASEAQVTTGTVGMVQPVFSRTGAVTLGHGCPSSVQATSAPALPAQPHTVSPLSKVAVSPDGKYLAGVGLGGNTVTVWASGATKPFSTLALSGVTAISWDRQDYLWAAHGSTTTMILQTSNNNSNHAAIPNFFPSDGKILGLSIAPDGVRVAVIVHTDAGSEVELAAIDNGKPELAAIDNGKPGPGQSANPFQHTSIGPSVQLGPNLTNPIALTWYDADDLLVLDGTGNQTSLWEVPVDGQPATPLPGVLPGAISITANSATNALVVGMTKNRMEVSAGLSGPWQPLGNGGQSPAFQAPAIPVAPQP